MRRILGAFLLVLCVPFAASAAAPAFLSEIGWAGSAASTSDEWLEVCGEADADLSGWVVEGAGTSGGPLELPPGSITSASGAFLIANFAPDDARSTLAGPAGWITAALSLSNSALRLVLKSPDGSVVDAAGASGSPLAGRSAAPRSSMERLKSLTNGTLPEAWATAEASEGFDAGAEELGTPGICPVLAPPEIPAITEPPTEATAATGTEAVMAAETPAQGDPGTPPQPEPMVTAVRVSEFYPAPRAGEDEWIELANRSGNGEFLDGWTIEDGKGAATRLSGLLLPWARLVIVSPKGSLNNDGDAVILKDALGRTVDGVAYGKWDAGFAPRVGTIKSGHAAAKKEPSGEWEITPLPTPNAENAFPAPETEETEEAAEPPTAPKPAAASPAAKPPVSEPKAAPAAAVTAFPIMRPAEELEKTGEAPKTAARVPASKFKGSATSAVILIPPSVYAKTRWYGLVGGELREIRMTKSSALALSAGDHVTFVAQEKSDGGVSYLQVNPNSLARSEEGEVEFVAWDAWPEASGTYRLQASVQALEDRAIRIRVGTMDAVLAVPSGTVKSALKSGDEVEFEAAVDAAGGRAYLAAPESLRLFKAFRAEASDAAAPAEKLSPIAAWLLAAGIMAAGLLAYLRRERIARLVMAGRQPTEDPR